MGLWDIDKIPYVGRRSLCHGLCCLLAYAARRWRTANS